MLHVADVMAAQLGLPVRKVHVVPGPGLRGEARRSALGRVARGDDDQVVGRPENVLAALAQAPGASLTILGASQRPHRPGTRRGSGTALAVARRVSCPLLLVPAAATDWDGPRQVVTALDGTGHTALAAASALTAIATPETQSTSLHIGMPKEPSALRNGQDVLLTRAGAVHGDDTRAAAEAHQRVPGVPPGQRLLKMVAEAGGDLVVMVWSRRTRGPQGSAVLDVLASTTVPLLLVPVTSPLVG